MCKRVIFATVGLTLVGVFVFGRHAASYVGTAVGRIKDSIKESVPVGFELDRARKMVKDLVPDIQRNVHVIAQEEVEVDRLDHQIADSRQKLERDKADLLRLKGDAEKRQAGIQLWRASLYGLAGQGRPVESFRAIQDGRRHAQEP